ncbi:uncharacterized protein LOC131071521 isoform X1 [Cryptomeria japonica]|uniref:uncharacterized protein LOC131071521 isoform X1 n=1 Tax=Cryptomeria japonica TaxID=3369 RepID=UPI0025AC6483|nr:uncharacterized protein LOC131071521 isoform X1 [Cryptomeria japonica]
MLDIRPEKRNSCSISDPESGRLWEVLRGKENSGAANREVFLGRNGCRKPPYTATVFSPLSSRCIFESNYAEQAFKLIAMGAPFKSSIYGTPGWKAQKMHLETKSSTSWWTSDDQVSSSSQNNEAYKVQLERGVTGKNLDSDQTSSHCKDKFNGSQSGKYSPDNCSPGINIAEEIIQNIIKVQNPTGLSEHRTGFCVSDTPPDTVVIDDDDTDTRVNNHDKSSSGEREDDDISTEMKAGLEISDADPVSDDSDTGCGYSFRRQTDWFYWKTMGQSPNCSRRVYVSTDVSDDEDDCQVFEPCSHSHFNAGTSQRQQKQRSSGHFRFIVDSDSDSSDCEIFENSDGEMRQKWEEAALRKRGKKGIERKQCEAGVKASISSSNLATDSSVRDGGPEVTTDRKDAGFESCSAGEGMRDPSDFSNGSGTNESSYQMDGDAFRTSEKLDTVCPSTSGPNMSDSAVPGKDNIQIASCTESKDLNASNKEETLNKSSPENSCCQSQEEENQIHTGTCILEGAKIESVVNENTGNWVCAREKLKETAEFRFADKEEWVNRQLELERQAKEVQQLRRRKRAEAERMLEMERRQKRRLEEIRITQKKEEQTMDQKEQLRDQVRSRLDEIASTCKDMASLLRSLGIPVEGGSLPSSQQVNAAYKKALLRFHPDRASVLNDGVRHQVEAEETFKMISRMKDTLPPVFTGYGNKTGW